MSVQSQLVWFIASKYVFLLQVLNKDKDISNAGYGVFSENRKN